MNGLVRGPFAPLSGVNPFLGLPKHLTQPVRERLIIPHIEDLKLCPGANFSHRKRLLVPSGNVREKPLEGGQYSTGESLPVAIESRRATLPAQPGQLAAG